MTIKQKIKLYFIKHSVEKEDKMIVYIPLENGNRIKSRAVVETYFPAIFYRTTIVVEAEDGNLHLISQKDIIKNYSARNRYKETVIDFNKENKKRELATYQYQGIFKEKI